MVFISSLFNAPYFSLAEERMAERLATWITIEDLREIKVNQSLLDTQDFLWTSCRSFIYFRIALTISLSVTYVIACTALKNSTPHFTCHLVREARRVEMSSASSDLDSLKI